MKKILFSILLFFVFFSAKTQTNIYHPFPTSNAVWSVYFSGYQSPWCYDRQYFIAGDTVVNTLTYHKIKYFGWQGSGNISGFCDYWNYNSSQIYLGAFREDTAQRKVYFLLPSYTTDTLLYDFTLNVGDTLPFGINNHLDPSLMIINSIDSILINGNYRKRFNIATTFFVSIIEGIGSTSGLTEDVMIFEWGGDLYCYSENNQEIYPNNSGSPCDLLLNESELTKASTFNIYPNPTTGKFEVNGEHLNVKSLEIYNIQGQKVKTIINNQSKTTNEIDVSELSEGIYLFKIQSKETSVYRKIIKTN